MQLKARESANDSFVPQNRPSMTALICPLCGTELPLLSEHLFEVNAVEPVLGVAAYFGISKF